VWDQTIQVVIVPSFLAIAYIGQSLTVNRFSINDFNLLSVATYLSLNGSAAFIQGELVDAGWGNALTLTSFVLSMAVNTLVTGLIVIKILKVFLKVNATTTSVERTLGTTGGTQLRHVIFIIIESGMALLAVQLVRFVLFNLPVQTDSTYNAYIIFIGINEMFNVIIRSIRFYFFCFTDKILLPG
jgi:hypothetical protein